MGAAKDINMEFAKVARKNLFIREQWPFPDKGIFDQPYTIIFNININKYIYIYIIIYVYI